MKAPSTSCARNWVGFSLKSNAIWLWTSFKASSTSCFVPRAIATGSFLEVVTAPISRCQFPFPVGSSSLARTLPHALNPFQKCWCCAQVFFPRARSPHIILWKAWNNPSFQHFMALVSAVLKCKIHFRAKGLFLKSVGSVMFPRALPNIATWLNVPLSPQRDRIHDLRLISSSFVSRGQ